MRYSQSEPLITVFDNQAFQCGFSSFSNKCLKVEDESDLLEFPNQVKYAYIPGFYCRQTNLLGYVSQKFDHVMVERGDFLPFKNLSHLMEKLFIHDRENFSVTLIESGCRFSEKAYAFNFDLLEDFQNLQTLYPKLHLALNLDRLFSPQNPFLKDFLSFFSSLQISFFFKKQEWKNFFLN